MLIARWAGATKLIWAAFRRVRPAGLHLVWLLALLSTTLLAPRAAEAHALLVRAEPQPNAELMHPPSAIEFWFSEPLEKAFTGARILRTDGTEVPTVDALIDPVDPTHLTLPLEKLGPGIYTVVWQTLSSVDGHEWVGSFPLTVLNADGSRPSGNAAVISGDNPNRLPPPGDALLRWLSLLGAVLLVGSLSLRWLLPQPAPAAADHEPLVDRLLTATAMTGLFSLIICGWLLFLFQAFRIAAIEELPDLLFTTRPGKLLMARQALLAGVGPLLYRGGYAGILIHSTPFTRSQFRFGALAISLYLMLCGLGLAGMFYYDLSVLPFVIALPIAASGWSEFQFRGKTTRHQPFLRRIWASLLAAAALLTFSASSHAAAARGSGWAVAADYIHLIAASVWAGGLLFLALFLLRLRRMETVPEQDRLVLLLQRFSLSAQVAVFALVLTGLFSGFVQLPAFSSLFETTYGRVLLTKVAIIAPIMALAFFNNRAVRKAAETVAQTRRLRPFMFRVIVEAGMVAALLGSISVLVQTPPPNASASAMQVESPLPFNEITYEGDLAIHLQVTPNRVGHNRYWVHLSRPGASEVGEVQLVRLSFDHESGQMGQARLDLAGLGDDAFAAEGAFLNRGGDWRVSVYVRRRGLDDLLAEVTVPVPSPDAAQESSRSPWLNPVPRLPAGVLVGGLLVALSLVPLLWRRLLLRASRPLFFVLVMGALLFFLSGALLGLLSYQQMNDNTPPPASQRPPHQIRSVFPV
ncbi:MAG: copper resistance protein CopC [Caldilineaceae bacterium]|nr:copper resistance protein CopC [Caldilineaceae bacterium]